MNELIVGIDLGTTNSELAVVRNGQVEVIPIHGQLIMPSCVGIDAQGRLVVGPTAKNQLVAAPDSTVLSIKRRMGEDIRVTLKDQSFSPEEISAFILRELKQEAERVLGQPVHKAVITVPAFFNERQRLATQMAGKLADLDVVRILNEPTAAALAYGAGDTAAETMLVYDLGGGTFDVSVVVVESGVVEVKASHGDTHLGGDDFDQLLVDRAVAEFQQRYGTDLHGNPQALRRLKVVMERAKWVLSDEPYASIREEYLDGEHHFEMELERIEYERLIQPLLEKTLHCVHQSLEDARLEPKDLHKVMLVGGATRTPLVHRLLLERLQLEPRFEINPDLIVAMGAALQGAVLAGEKPKSILVDITPHTFSTTAISDFGDEERVICVPILPRNTPLPATKSEVVYTRYDNQDKTLVEAYQGENPLPEQNIFIGAFRVEGLSRVPEGNPILIHFELDLNGMLKVTATEKITGLAKTVTMDTRGEHRFDLDEARQNVAALMGSSSLVPAPPSEPAGEAGLEEALTIAKELRKRGEALLQTSLDSDDADEINLLLRRSAAAIANRDGADLKDANNALSDLLFYLED